VQGLIQKAVQEFGRLDIMVNNAGVEQRMPFL
jgi:NAD(P)-dependent dehydrogenase (short-subunit alcohol dehydrogenase family)